LYDIITDAIPSRNIGRATSAWDRKNAILFKCGERRIRTFELVRGQIYSLLPLATWLSPRDFILYCSDARTRYKKIMSRRRDSNPRPADYKSAALPAELHRPFHSFFVSNSNGINALHLGFKELRTDICSPFPS
jgi:hypothetical protein